jgi:hypothetical protein
VALFNYTTMQLTAKIVYYGPGLCGKTTNLQAIHQKTAPQARGEMLSLETETDRTLFFDLLPLDVGVIGGMRTRLQLYTVPGQVFYNATRKLVLKGVDGIVFVADSQAPALDANLESLHNLSANLTELKQDLERIPLVFQYNKRDLRNVLPIEEIERALNPRGLPSFEASAVHGIGVFETLREISRLAIITLRNRIGEGSPEAGPRAAPDAETVASAVAEAPPTDNTNPLAALVHRPAPKAPPPPPPPEAATAEVQISFADAESGRAGMRAIPIKSRADIERELADLRGRALGGAAALPAPAPTPVHAAPSRDIDRRLKDLMGADGGARQDYKRKGSAAVPADVLRRASAVHVHLVVEGENGEEETLRDVVLVRLVDSRRLDRLSLHLELEVKAHRPGPR